MGIHRWLIASLATIMFAVGPMVAGPGGAAWAQAPAGPLLRLRCRYSLGDYRLCRRGSVRSKNSAARRRASFSKAVHSTPRAIYGNGTDRLHTRHKSTDHATYTACLRDPISA